jgi:predicted nucleotidyltransferase
MTPAQQSLIDSIMRVLTADPRIESAWLSGSFGRGEADDWSDVDVTVVAAERTFDDTVRAYSSDLSAIANVVYMNVIAGRVVNAVTDEWARFDLTFLKPAEFAARAVGPMTPIVTRSGASVRPPALPAPYASSAQRVTGIVSEYLRILGLSPVVLGRNEYLVAMDGVGHMRRLTIELFLEEAGINQAARGGALHLNRLLTDDQRRALASVPPVEATRESVIAAQEHLTHLFLPTARALARKTGATWPSSFEDATRRTLEKNLGLEI